MHRKQTANVFRDLPDLIYRMLSRVAALAAWADEEIAAMKVLPMPQERAHHLMVEAVRANVLPASRLPKVIEAWEAPRFPEFKSRTAWTLFNALTEVLRGTCPRAQMEGSLLLSLLFRKGLHQR